MKKIICSAIIGLSLVMPFGNIYAQTMPAPPSQGAAEQIQGAPQQTQGLPEVFAECAILIDANTGKIIFEKEKDKQKFPASTTKVMTAILAIENLDLSKNLPIDHDAAFTEGSRIYLLENEQITGEEALYGLMLESANDAAIAFAKNISGNTAEFAELMNKRAKELGAKNTHFSNPNGLPDDTHVTTAYDLAMIAKHAMKNETFRKVVGTYQHTIEATNLQPARYLYNSNRLLWDNGKKLDYNGQKTAIKYEGATGIKTGFTKVAGNCLVASAQRDGMELIGVVLQSDSNNQFLDIIKMFDYGFANYKPVSIAKSGDLVGNLTVKKGAEKLVGAVIPQDIVVALPADVNDKLIEKVYDLPEKIEAPIKDNQVLGTMKLYYDHELLGEYELDADRAIEVGGFSAKFAGAMPLLDILKVALPIVMGILVVLIALYFMLSMAVKIKKHKRKQRKLRLSKELQKQEQGIEKKEYDRAKYESEYGSVESYRSVKSGE